MTLYSEWSQSIGAHGQPIGGAELRIFDGADELSCGGRNFKRQLSRINPEERTAHEQRAFAEVRRMMRAADVCFD